jgi:transposase-like protein
MGNEQAQRRELWQQRIGEQEKSGASIRAYCKRHGLAEHAFYSWRKQLRTASPMTFALVETTPSKDAAMIELVLAQGDRLRIPADEATLRIVLSALRAQP